MQGRWQAAVVAPGLSLTPSTSEWVQELRKGLVQNQGWAWVSPQITFPSSHAIFLNSSQSLQGRETSVKEPETEQDRKGDRRTEAVKRIPKDLEESDEERTSKPEQYQEAQNKTTQVSFSATFFVPPEPP